MTQVKTRAVATGHGGTDANLLCVTLRLTSRTLRFLFFYRKGRK